MRLRTLTLHHFRNVGFARIEFSGRRHFFVGANGQGKTNLLEAAGFITALRSFRTADTGLLRGHLQPVAAIACDIEHERRGDSHVTIKLHREGRELWCDKVRVTRLADHLGNYPTVVFSSQDLQLVRGSPAGRRRWLDLTMAGMDPAYLNGLQTYTRALAERNALLKRGLAADAELEAFERTLAPPAAELIALRTAGLRSLGGLFREAYGKLCEGAEEAELVYAPNFADPSPEVLLARLESWRARDKQFRTTLAGPHRDDVDFKVGGKLAKDFSSEGQQRSLVLALRLAQAAWFQARCGVRPVLLADDVLGELDPDRRRRFWAAMDPESQVLATGTAPPDAELGKWQMFGVAGGAFDEMPVPVEEVS